MNTAHWHLLLNHLPIVGTIIGTLILIAGYLFKGNPDVKRIALGVFVFSALFAIPAFLTGDGAEDAVEKMPGVTENAINVHEELGEIYLVILSILGVLSIFTFIMDARNSKFAPTLYVIALLISIGSFIYAKQVGTTGGEIRHTEIRSGAIQQQEHPMEQGHHEDKDND